jgi:hypothetical protein
MGCDYYITKGLYILLSNRKDSLWIELERTNGYFNYGYMDEDEDDYKEETKKAIKQDLTPIMKPIVMYENNIFVKEVFKDKYYRIISECLIENKCVWEDVVKIRKVEERYERS